MARRIAVIGAKGGVGKSVTTALIGMVVSDLGKVVTIVDGDFSSPTQDLIFEVSGKVLYDIIDVIEHGCSPQKALVRVYDNENLYLLPVASFDGQEIGYQQVKAVVNEVARFSDFVFVDCPSGLEKPFLRAALSCDEGIIVVDDSPSGLRSAKRTIDTASSFGMKIIGFVLNCKKEDKNKLNRIFEENLMLKCVGTIRASYVDCDIKKLVAELV